MRARKILIVDNSADFRSSVINTIGRAFFITEAGSEAEFRNVFRPYSFELVILDMRLETGREGLRLLREILTYDELQPVIMVSAYGDTDAVLDATESGALMFLHKQEFTPELLARMVEAVLQQARVRRHLAALESRLPANDHLALSGPNPMVRRALEQVRKAADRPEGVVLVSGERGAGQALVAQSVHEQSRTRSTAPLVMAAGFSRSGEDMEKRFFGAPSANGTPRQKGFLEQANGGVLFLDGMADLKPRLQERIVTALSRCQLDTCTPPVPLDVQLVIGVLPDAAAEITDLLQRTGFDDRLIEIYLPPLRDRRGDIPLLAASYLNGFRQVGLTFARTIDRDALARLEGHAWPGNLFELRNIVEYAAIQAMITGNEALLAGHLPENLRRGGNEARAGGWDYRYHAARAEVALVERAIKEDRAENKTQLAELLGYTDRFAIGRRMRKTLGEHASFAAEFPRVAGWFGPKAKVPKATTP
uniref:Two-component system, NtrC family, response regulator PilR n=1 Tax=Candidatus Kentrum sp. FM TaxID=2126340 RepID=A0A450VVY0_9GAMM|nr:MAG: two-component system, NtrC family, response regulator PilR [Candidatus Kentron sp. FM]VFJ51193.1 MAG: two-component system, NtrC family, response regulator PilR [Candidatus Kentron sp. FM]VFK08856.1 MAG: two-component system, NtrC family, response regulator PilR [Candidatus Kentron sp. FM]